jgi:hypothetical protein
VVKTIKISVMYRLWNYLFGWDYVIWNNSADQGIAKVITLPDGTIGYWRYKITNIFDEINNPNQVKWLTCSPNKYFKP